MHKKFGLLTFQIRLKRNLPRRSFWGIVLVTLLCLNLSRVRKEYLLQRRLCRQNNPRAVPERPSWMVYCSSSPHMQISCLEKHLQLQTAPLCITSALSFLPSSMGCAKSVLQSGPCLQIRDFKGRRHHWDSKLLSRLMSCIAHPTVCSQQSRHLNQEPRAAVTACLGKPRWARRTQHDTNSAL